MPYQPESSVSKNAPTQNHSFQILGLSNHMCHPRHLFEQPAGDCMGIRRCHCIYSTKWQRSSCSMPTWLVYRVTFHNHTSPEGSSPAFGKTKLAVTWTWLINFDRRRQRHSYCCCSSTTKHSPEKQLFIHWWCQTENVYGHPRSRGCTKSGWKVELVPKC